MNNNITQNPSAKKKADQLLVRGIANGTFFSDILDFFGKKSSTFFLDFKKQKILDEKMRRQIFGVTYSQPKMYSLSDLVEESALTIFREQVCVVFSPEKVGDVVGKKNTREF